MYIVYVWCLVRYLSLLWGQVKEVLQGLVGWPEGFLRTAAGSGAFHPNTKVNSVSVIEELWDVPLCGYLVLVINVSLMGPQILKPGSSRATFALNTEPKKHLAALGRCSHIVQNDQHDQHDLSSWTCPVTTTVKAETAGLWRKHLLVRLIRLTVIDYRSSNVLHYSLLWSLPQSYSYRSDFSSCLSSGICPWISLLSKNPNLKLVQGKKSLKQLQQTKTLNLRQAECFFRCRRSAATPRHVECSQLEWECRWRSMTPPPPSSSLKLE